MHEELPLPPPVIEQRQALRAGWVVTGIMLLFWISSALLQYFSPRAEEKGFGNQQDQLKYFVNLKYSSPSGADIVFDGTVQTGFKTIIEQVRNDVSKSDEAARISVVASGEIKAEPSAVAMNRLRDSKLASSQLIFRLNQSGDVERSDVEALEKIGSREYAVKLALVQAKESLGEANARSSIGDRYFVTKMMFVMLGIAVAAIAGVVCLAMFFDARRQGKWVAVRNIDPTIFGGERYALRFGLYMFTFTALGYVSQIVAPKQNEIWVGVCVFVATILTTLFFLTVDISGVKDSLSKVIGLRNNWGRLVLQGLYGYACLIPILLAMLLIVVPLYQFFPQPSHPIEQEIRNAGGLDWLAIILTAVVFAPFIEELTFRGLLFPALTTVTKRPLWAMLISGFLFAAIHPQGPLIWPVLMSVGVVSAYLRYHTGSLIPSIVLHTLHNGLIMVVSLLSI